MLLNTAKTLLNISSIIHPVAACALALVLIRHFVSLYIFGNENLICSGL